MKRLLYKKQFLIFVNKTELSVKVYYNLNNFNVKRPIVTIGTFDGVHLGHLKVISQLKEISRNADGETVLFTFFPHPRMVVNPSDKSLRLLSSLDEKIEMLRDAGIEHLVIFPFTLDFAKLSYDQFIKLILIDKMHFHTLVLGFDHQFGRNREGNYESILKLSKELNFKVIKIEAFEKENVDVSSSKIRRYLLDGNVIEANSFLGSPYSISGIVREGNHIGRTIGYPTANVEILDPYKLIPATGVYAARVTTGMYKQYYGMLNIGYCPTVSKHADKRTIEVHIFNFGRNLYGTKIKLELLAHIRDEIKFPDIDALKNQLQKDEQAIKSLVSFDENA